MFYLYHGSKSDKPNFFFFLFLHDYFADPLTESRPERSKLDIYVPSDEQLSPKKLSELISNVVQAAVHFLFPETDMFQQDSRSFSSFEETSSIFFRKRNQVVEKWVKETLKKMVPDKLYKEVIHASKENPLEFLLPQIIIGEVPIVNLYRQCNRQFHFQFCFLFSENKLAWLDDQEFGRQMLAGVNPTRIKSLKVPTTLMGQV
jgi:lipoxygenase